MTTASLPSPVPETPARPLAAHPQADGRVSLALAQAALRLRAGRQKRIFRALAGEFAPLYHELSAHPIDRFVTPLWARFNADLEPVVLPRPPFAFLRHSVIKRTMFVDARGTLLASQTAFLRSLMTDHRLGQVLPDEPVGDPPLAVRRWRASHNSVHHLCHLERFRAATGADPCACGPIVEWGGGYGNLARLVRRLAGHAVTYTIVDTPLFCCLQWAFLATVFGRAAVHVIRSPEDAPRPRVFNILPVGLVERVKPEAGLFISTWALSESSPAAQDWAAAHGLGARRLLLAFQESSPELPDAGRIRALATAAGAAVTPVPGLEGNAYAFR